jgi:hypothetical protein
MGDLWILWVFKHEQRWFIGIFSWFEHETWIRIVN